MSRVLRAAAVLAGIFATNLALAHEFKIKDFEFIHPWTREPARGVKDVPVYMVLRNTASTPDRIVAVSSPFATSVCPPRLAGCWCFCFRSFSSAAIARRS